MMEDETNLWQISVVLSKFLTITECPARWKLFDLYLIRDAQVAFYAGQSYCAFERVWDHLKAGIHGHSIVGRFVLCNWPKSGRFLVDLLNSQSPQFTGVGNDLDAAERSIIEAYSPCFNVVLNNQPATIPAGYLPPNASIKHWKNFRRMLREAEFAAERSNAQDMEWN